MSRLKVIEVSEDVIMLLFEVWDPNDYSYTAYILVDKDGYPIVEDEDKQVMELCYPMRLLKADDPIIQEDGSILLIDGTDDYNGRLSTYKITIEL